MRYKAFGRKECMAHEFFVLALTIFIGFVSTKVFEKTRVSQVILLMLFGVLLGPVLGVMDVSPDSVIVSILPFIATLALIVLLFDGGLEFDIFSVARSIPRSMLFTLLVFIIGILLVGGFLALALGWPLSQSILLGTVASGTSSAIVIAMVERTGTLKETKSLLTVESTMTDALCIISAMIIVQIITAQTAPGPGTVVGLLLSSFTTAIVIGAVFALLWIAATKRFSVEKYSYMLMLALVFIVFWLTDQIGGNGGFAVFTFGIVLGNARKIGKVAKAEWENPMGHVMKTFQDEVTFFVRTFFFVYIGLLLSLDYFTPTIALLSIVMVAIYMVPRAIVQKILMPGIPLRDKRIIVSMMPRGLAAAVLATIPLTSGIPIPNFQELVFGVLFFSNVAATLGIFAFDRGG